MKIFNFNQTGGFPLTTETLAKIQDAYGIVEKVARMAGNFAIITGCEEQGAQITSGVVMVNGELLEFRGGIKGATVFVGTETASLVFENGENHTTETTRYAAFGVGAEQYPWASFKRVAPLNAVEARLAKMEKLMSPLLDGGILLWNKPANTIPAGWAEATEFRGRMPFGWNPDDGDFSSVGQTGGEKEHTLTEAEMPMHRHSQWPFDKYVANANDIGGSTSSAASFDSATPMKEVAIGGLTNSQMQQMTELEKGYNAAHNNMSPYRIVMFIKYIG